MQPTPLPAPGRDPWPESVRLAGRVAAPAHDPEAIPALRADDPARYYVGRRPRETEVHVVTVATVEPLVHLGYRSAAPFDWGTSTAGALELAFALLIDTARSRPPDAVCRAFLADVVSVLEPDGFVLEAGDVALWLLTASRGGPDAGGSGGRHRSLRRLAAAWIAARLRKRRAS
ncbi:MAG: DUF6166 domain-containing protein [Solirubrobacteraceae bacterium]